MVDLARPYDKRTLNPDITYSMGREYVLWTTHGPKTLFCVSSYPLTKIFVHRLVDLDLGTISLTFSPGKPKEC